MDDYLLVYRWLTNDGRKPANIQNMDADHFLRTFFTQSALSRLSACALAVDFLDTSDATSFEYYRRARKAVIRESGIVSFENVLSMYRLYQFASWKGQPLIGMQFLKMAFDMIKELRLDVDPDDSPWLQHLQLTERQKEERRRAYWSPCFMWSQAYALSFDVFEVEICMDSVRPPKVVFDHGTLIFDRSNFHLLCKLNTLLGKAKRFLSTPPPSITDLLRNESRPQFYNLLNSFYEYVPPELLLITEATVTLKASDIDRFLGQLGQNPVSIMVLNLFSHTARSILERPILFLTNLASCMPMYLNTHDTNIILSSVRECLSSAHRIVNLILFCLSTKPSNLQDAFAAFEAITVFWFVKCRMRPAWRALVDPSLFQMDDVKRKVAIVQEFVLEYEKRGVAGMIPPIARCIEAMVREMQRADGLGVKEQDKNEGLEPLELGMQVMSLIGQESEVDVKEPYVFLGLLGLEVSGGVRWKCRSEEGWRLFWKVYG
ncbi:hypothetical protein HDU79_002165 [Rhizoclosmatium sp. JEL0117]|nr:hypothetical protein HDU79_002165 [Rhizoclosmatium sp. JEL0117]